MKKFFYFALLLTTVFCFFAGTIQAAEQGQVYGWGFLKLPNEPLTNINQIAAGDIHSLALKSDGTIVGWGDNRHGQATPPGEAGFVAISAGDEHGLALRLDGSIVGWGWDEYGQATPLDGNDFVAITAGHLHSLALKSDGSIVGWGNDWSGQATPPEGNDFVSIAAGKLHSLALRSDGSIVGWGFNEYGQATPPEERGFIAIAGGGNHSVAIRGVCGYRLVGDVNDDCRFDVADFSIMAENWLIDCDVEPLNEACEPK